MDVRQEAVVGRGSGGFLSFASSLFLFQICSSSRAEEGRGCGRVESRGGTWITSAKLWRVDFGFTGVSSHGGFKLLAVEVIEDGGHIGAHLRSSARGKSAAR